MSNTLLTPSVIAKEALLVLENNLVLGAFVHRDYSNEFAKVGNTIKIRKPATFVANVWDGATLNIQSITEANVSVVMNTVLDVSFNISALELTQNIVAFSEQIIQPAMRAHAQKIDELLAGLYVDVPYAVAVSSTANVADIANARKKLNQNKVPMENRCGVLEPQSEAKYLVLDAFLHAEKRGDTEAVKNGSMGRVLGIDWYMDQNMRTHDAGTTDLAGVLNGAQAKASTSVVVNGLGTGNVTQGTLLTIANCVGVYCVKDTVAIATNAATLNIAPALEAAAADGAVVTLIQGKRNLVFHKNAFALVTRPLEKSFGAGYSAVENYKGISARVTAGYTMASKADTMSLDILLGIKTLTPELAVQLYDAN